MSNEMKDMINAIVYVSETGHTKQYAELLSEKTGLPVLTFAAARKDLPKGCTIIYLGWLMAGTVKGYKKAAKLFDIKALCGVGMSGGDTQLADIRKTNQIPDALPVFYLQGGFEMEKLHGIYRLMMKSMKAVAGKKLSEKKDKTPEEDAMLELLLHGENTVSADNVSEILSWYEKG